MFPVSSSNFVYKCYRGFECLVWVFIVLLDVLFGLMNAQFQLDLKAVFFRLLMDGKSTIVLADLCRSLRTWEYFWD